MSDSSAPLVSVVIAAYNAEAHLAATLRSVAAQTLEEDGYEVIVVDDGSTDGTAALAEAHGARVIRQENRGQPAARNTGIRAARGRYVAFVDADDLWAPEKLARQVAYHRARPDLRWSYTDLYTFRSKTGEILGTAGQMRALPEGDVLRAMLLHGFISSPTPMLRREVFEEVGFFNESPAVHIGEDWEMWLRVAARYPVGLLREPLAYVRVHETSMIRSMKIEDGLESRLRILEGAFARHPELARELRARAEANVYARVGRLALNQDERALARRLFWKALRRAPLHPLAWRYGAASLLPWPALRAVGALRRLFWKAQRQGRGSAQASGTVPSFASSKGLSSEEQSSEEQPFESSQTGKQQRATAATAGSSNDA